MLLVASRASAISIPNSSTCSRGSGLPENTVFQGLPVEKLHGDEGSAIFFADVVTGTDIGMGQGRGGFGFTPESFHATSVGSTHV